MEKIIQNSVTDIKDYDLVIEGLRKGDLTEEERRNLAYKAFSTTGRYDAMISTYFAEQVGEDYPEFLNLTFQKEQTLRYGENPHQNGILYAQPNAKNPILNYEQLNGKELSFNNLNDLHGCLEVMREFKDSDKVAAVAIKHTNPCGVALGDTALEAYTKCYEADKTSIFGGIVGFKDSDKVAAVAIKHTNPCGVALGDTALEAYTKCYEADKTSIFGGIVGITSTVDKATAEELHKIFLEIVVAYDFTDEALEVLRTKKNLRVLKLAKIEDSKQKYEMKYLDGKLLIQDKDTKLADKYETVTKLEPTEEELEDMKFGMKIVKNMKSNKIVKNMKSNAIAVVKDGQTLALGCGQTSRIWALKNALENNKDEKDFTGATLASDAFFPFDDCVTLANEFGIKSIVQPGGSIRDNDSIEACDKFNMSMVFTGVRHFKH